MWARFEAGGVTMRILLGLSVHSLTAWLRAKPTQAVQNTHRPSSSTAD